eukprot:Mrub_04774.p1 GENE.Mrub_04774~~Mrub_04774.p1  ORF type:complete len:336 (-),score=165.19 Mrub_04774:91-1098(-)
MQEQKEEISEILRKFLNNEVDSELIRRAEHMLWYLEHARPDSGLLSSSADYGQTQNAHKNQFTVQRESRADNDWLGTSGSGRSQTQNAGQSQELGRLGPWATTVRAEAVGSFGSHAQAGPGPRKDSTADSRSEHNAGLGFDFGKWPRPGGTALADGDVSAQRGGLPDSFWASSATAFPADDRRLRALGWGPTPTLPAVAGEGWWFERPSQAQSLATTQPGSTASWGTWDLPRDFGRATATAFGRFDPTPLFDSDARATATQLKQVVPKDIHMDMEMDTDQQPLRWIDDVPSTQTFPTRAQQTHSRWIDALDTHARIGTKQNDYDYDDDDDQMNEN